MKLWAYVGSVRKGASSVASTAKFPVDMREGVIWAYRHLLGREPNDEGSIVHHMRHTPESLRQAFMQTAEYQQRNVRPATKVDTRPPPDLQNVLSSFEPFATEAAPAGSFRDFLGVLTRCNFLPDNYTVWSGVVHGPPGSPHGQLHEPDEWIGTLRSVLEARKRLVVVELGAGWAPWLVASAVAAKKLGISDVQLIGVEGSQGHCEFMKLHFQDNGIDPAKHRLMHAVAGAQDGVAYFPKLDSPANNYGSEADYQGMAKSSAPRPSDMEEVPSISLKTLLADLPRVDILHCDIQGMEADVFEAGGDVVEKHVRRVVIGTHSRAVEARLLDLFGRMNWVLEHESVCQVSQGPNGPLHLVADGTQVWSNPRLAPQS